MHADSLAGTELVARQLGPRAAEFVAGHLRDLILRGRLADGDALPRQDALSSALGVSAPSLREGLRILEADGLIVIRRGRTGGAFVQAPNSANVAYSLGLVLQMESVPLADLAAALDELEPTCFALVAARPDRHVAVVPALRRTCDDLAQNIENDADYTTMAREFHEIIVTECGNATIRVAVGALSRLWAIHEKKLLADRRHAGDAGEGFDERRSILVTHRRLMDLIDRGDVEGTRDLAAKHLAASRPFILSSPDSEDGIDVSLLPFAERND